MLLMLTNPSQRQKTLSHANLPHTRPVNHFCGNSRLQFCVLNCDAGAYTRIFAANYSVYLVINH